MASCLRRTSRASARKSLEGVAGPPHRTDRVAIAAADQRLPEPAHVYIHGTAVDEGIAPPHAIEQLLARQHAPHVLHEEGEQLELCGAQAHLAFAARDAMGGAIEYNIARTQYVGNAGGCRPAQQRLYACHQLEHG